MDTQKLNSLVDRLYSEWCLGQEKYLNVAAIKTELKTVITDHVSTPEWKTRHIDDDSSDELMNELVLKVQDILVILETEYVGVRRGLDRRVCEMDLEIEAILREFLDR